MAPGPSQWQWRPRAESPPDLTWTSSEWHQYFFLWCCNIGICYLPHKKMFMFMKMIHCVEIFCCCAVLLPRLSSAREQIFKSIPSLPRSSCGAARLELSMTLREVSITPLQGPCPWWKHLGAASILYNHFLGCFTPLGSWIIKCNH